MDIADLEICFFQGRKIAGDLLLQNGERLFRRKIRKIHACSELTQERRLFFQHQPDCIHILFQLREKALLELFYRNIGTCLAFQKILVIFLSAGEMGKAAAGDSGTFQSLQAGHQFFVGGDHFFEDDLFVPPVQFLLFFLRKFSVFLKALRKKIDHIAGFRIADKRSALLQDPVRRRIAHEQSRVRFFLFKFKNTVEIRFYGDQQIQIIGNILIFVKGVFRQKDRELGLDAETGRKHFLQKFVSFQRSLRMEIQEQHIQSEAVFLGKFRKGKSPEFFYVSFIKPEGFAHIRTDRTQGRRGALNPLFFRMCQRVVEIQHVSGSLLFKNFPGKSFEPSVFGPDMVCEIPQSDAGCKGYAQKERDKGRRPESAQ